MHSGQVRGGERVWLPRRMYSYTACYRLDLTNPSQRQISHPSCAALPSRAQANGEQTVKGYPELILGVNDFDTPACCPNGVSEWFNSAGDNCCVDTLSDNPYRYKPVFLLATPLISLSFGRSVVKRMENNECLI